MLGINVDVFSNLRCLWLLCCVEALFSEELILCAFISEYLENLQRGKILGKENNQFMLGISLFKIFTIHSVSFA